MATVKERTFGMFPENTLLHHLLEMEYDPQDYIDLLDNIEDAEADKKQAEEHPEDYDEEELSYIDDDIAYWKEQIVDFQMDWKPKKKLNMEEEIETIKKWINKVEELKEDGQM